MDPCPDNLALAHESDPVELHESARRHAADALRYFRRIVVRYETAPASPERDADIGRLDALRALAGAKEADSLRELNAYLLAVGQPVGNEVVIRGHVYRACKPGGLALHLGVEVPSGDGLDGEITDGDERREWAALYADATVVH